MGIRHFYNVILCDNNYYFLFSNTLVVYQHIIIIYGKDKHDYVIWSLYSVIRSGYYINIR